MKIPFKSFYTLDANGFTPFKIDIYNQSVVVSQPTQQLFNFENPVQVLISHRTVLVRPTHALNYILISSDIKSFWTVNPILYFCSIVTQSGLVFSYGVSRNGLYMFQNMQLAVLSDCSNQTWNLICSGSMLVYDAYYGKPNIGLSFGSKTNIEYTLLVNRTNPVVKFYTANL